MCKQIRTIKMYSSNELRIIVFNQNDNMKLIHISSYIHFGVNFDKRFKVFYY